MSTCYGTCVVESRSRCEQCNHHSSFENRRKLLKSASVELDSWEHKGGQNVSPEKIEINEKFCQLLSPLLTQPRLAQCLTLDGSDFYTSRNLIKLGISPSNISVPAPFLSTHEEKMNSSSDSKSINLKSINLTREFVFDTLTKQAPNTLVAIFLDYLSTFNGNKYTVPRLDLEILFSRQVLRSDAVLGITVSTRDCRSTTRKSIERREEKIAQVCEAVATIAANHGYLIIPSWTKFYSPAMFVCIFVVKRANQTSQTTRIDQEEKLDKIINLLSNSNRQNTNDSSLVIYQPTLPLFLQREYSNEIKYSGQELSILVTLIVTIVTASLLAKKPSEEKSSYPKLSLKHSIDRVAAEPSEEKSSYPKLSRKHCIDRLDDCDEPSEEKSTYQKLSKKHRIEKPVEKVWKLTRSEQKLVDTYSRRENLMQIHRFLDSFTRKELFDVMKYFGVKVITGDFSKSSITFTLKRYFEKEKYTFENVYDSMKTMWTSPRSGEPYHQMRLWQIKAKSKKVLFSFNTSKIKPSHCEFCSEELRCHHCGAYYVLKILEDERRISCQIN
jgi:uncharacterized protein YkuJ